MKIECFDPWKESSIEVTQDQLTHLKPGLFAPMSNCKELRLSNLGISEIDPGSFEQLESLESLSLSRNSDLNSLPYDTFRDLHKLTHLYLIETPLRELSEGSFHGLSSLRSIHLAWNDFRILPEGIFSETQLKVLLLKYNPGLQYTPNMFQGLSFLQTLDLGQTNLHAINSRMWSDTPTINALFFRDNKITEITGDSFSNLPLDSLTLSKNLIDSISNDAFLNNSKLEYLALDENRLTHISAAMLSPLSQLKTLILGKNAITELGPNCFQHNPELTQIWLDSNKLTAIHASTFPSLSKLETVYLQYNEIATIDEASFSDTPRLQYLTLFKNKLRSIPDLGISPSDSGAVLEFEIFSNPLQCESGLCWIQRAVDSGRIKQSVLQERCSSSSGKQDLWSYFRNNCSE